MENKGTLRNIHRDREPTVPFKSKDLIAELVASYPPRSIARGEDLIDAHRYAAKAELVAELKAALDEDEDEARTPGD